MFIDMISTCSTKLIQAFLRKSGNFDVKDAPRSGRPIIRKDEIMEKIKQDRYISSHDIDKELNIDPKQF